MSKRRGIKGIVVPRATYRLQLHEGFGFDDAAGAVPYIASLGVSHVYASPIMTARPGSIQWGAGSPRARAFDIDWKRPDARGKLILPILGSHYGDALESRRAALMLRGWGVRRLRRPEDDVSPLPAGSVVLAKSRFAR